MGEVLLVLFFTKVAPFLLAIYVAARYWWTKTLVDQWYSVKRGLDLGLLYADTEHLMVQLSEQLEKHLTNRPKVPWWLPWLK